MLNGRIGRAAVALGALMIIASPAISAGGQRLASIGKLEPGLYQLRNLSGADAPRQICVADPAVLLQVQHKDTPCSRMVIDQKQNSATVHYTCPANGFGHTSMRVETSRLAKIDTQGISGNAPFSYRAEARRVGACS